MSETCATCRYSIKDTCFRYPTSIRVIPTHWCGEWKERIPAGRENRYRAPDGEPGLDRKAIDGRVQYRATYRSPTYGVMVVHRNATDARVVAGAMPSIGDYELVVVERA